MSYDTANVVADGDSLISSDYVFRVGHQAEVSELRLGYNLGLCHGVRGMTYYWTGTSFSFLGDGYKIYPGSGDTLYWGGRSTSIIGNDFGSDTLTETTDLHLQNYEIRIEGEPKIPAGAYRDTIQDVWVGWDSRSRAVKANNLRVDSLGTEMIDRRLRWRDGYSVHNQEQFPNDPLDTNISPRPIPSDEIITSVTAEHPVSGEVDSAYATYVELGLFYTVTDTAADPNPMNDTNYVYVVNRRTFERPPDVSDTTLRGKIMDTLTESRRIRMKLNLKHPIEDSVGYEQYAFLRVREVMPTHDTIPLLGPRPTLDTVISAKGTLDLVLRPGGGALLEITYKKPDKSIEDGNLWSSNQRKFLWDGNRYHATYSKGDTIWYRRSMPMIDTSGVNTGSILWHEPVAISDPQTQSTFTPSLTLRRIKGDTVATIVWSHHRDDTTRTVVLRKVAWEPDSSDYLMSDIEFIANHNGEDGWVWGTPVVCRMDGHEMIAWSDSTQGIQFRTRVLDTTGATWWTESASAQYTDVVDLCSSFWGCYPTSNGNGRSMYPSIPPFAHLNGLDSTCGLAWSRQPFVGGGSDIWYCRLQYDTNAGSSVWRAHNPTMLSSYTTDAWMPSVDQSQDHNNRIQDGIAWNYREYDTDNDVWRTGVYYRSVFTPKTDGWGGDADHYGAPQAWGMAKFRAYEDVAFPPESPYVTSAWAKEIEKQWTNGDSILYTLDFNTSSSTPMMAQQYVNYGEEYNRIERKNHSFGGKMPQNASAPMLAPTRKAVMYHTGTFSQGTLRTSREFFAKSRPTGYTAHGREIALRTTDVDDTLQTRIVGTFHDIWFADADTALPLDLVGRQHTSTFIDSIEQAEDLLITVPFDSYDTVTFGYELGCVVMGDTLAGDTAEASLIVELIDTSSGAVYAQLDSIGVAVQNMDSIYSDTTRDIDLVSGTYRMRVRILSEGIREDALTSVSVVPVTEMWEEIPTPPSKRVSRFASAGADVRSARMTIDPNPIEETGQILFTVYDDAEVTLRATNMSGESVRTFIDDRQMEEGRYRYTLDASLLPVGAYMLYLATDNDVVSRKLIIAQ